MLFQDLLNAVNGRTLKAPKKQKLWTEAADRICVHAKGIRPRFKNPRKNAKNGVWITPANYEVRYQYLFDDYILNRHPNENESHYYWRLATFPLIAQEIYLNAKLQVLGAIFQQNQYVVKAHEEADQEYLDSIKFIETISEIVPEHILTDPHGKFAVVESHFEAFDASEKAIPKIELIESRYIRYFVEKEQILFQSSTYYNDRKVLYYIDKEICVKLLNMAVDQDGQHEKYQVIAVYPHGFGELPVVDNETNFFQTYVSWADMLARNISDDEVIAKNASYPHKQVVEPVCQKCMGARKLAIPDQFHADGSVKYMDCDECEGRGTISINPGDTYVVKERDRNDARPMDDYVRFINPDISINEFSFERWQKIYDFGMRSLHLKYVEEAQSGVAKGIDREQLYYLISGIANKIFDVTELLLRYMLRYLNMRVVDGNARHVENSFSVERPKQFQIKTEYDIQEEYLEIIEKNGDILVRRAKLEKYFEKAFAGDVISLKKFKAIKLFDFLYSMTDTELNTVKILGSATTNDFIRHARAEFLFNNILEMNGDQWVAQTDIKLIVDQMEKDVETFLVKSNVGVDPTLLPVNPVL